MAHDRTGATTRVFAVRVLERIERDAAWSTRALDAALRSDDEMSSADRRFVTRLVYGTLQRQGTLDHHLSLRLRKPLDKTDAMVRRLLRIGAEQLLHMDEVPDHASVNATLLAAVRTKRGGARGLINAILRKLARDRDAGRLTWPDKGKAPVAHLSAIGSLPKWLAELWAARLGIDDALDLARTCNERPPATLRVNRSATTVEAVIEALGGEPTGRAVDGVELHQGLGEALRHPTFDQGWWSVQDQGSMLVTEALDPRPGDRVLDLCAAPGGKTCHVAERLGGRGVVDAVDIHPKRTGLIRESVARLGLEGSVRIHTGDGTDPGLQLPESSYDAVLVDAPCSALGTLQRHPEKKWRPPPELAELAHRQHALLTAGSGRVAPGGRLVYAVCSTELEEGEAVVDAFLQDTGGRFEETGRWRLWPHRDGTEGFFYARLQRSP